MLTRRGGASRYGEFYQPAQQVIQCAANEIAFEQSLIVTSITSEQWRELLRLSGLTDVALSNMVKAAEQSPHYGEKLSGLRGTKLYVFLFGNPQSA